MGYNFFDMEKRIVNILNDVNARFYRDHAESFSQTRKNPWEGWFPIGEALDTLAETMRDKTKIIDVGCGNMRFESFLDSTYPLRRFECTCIDSSANLIPEDLGYRFIQRDIVSDVAEGRHVFEDLGETFDAAVAFGLMHHVPGRENRKEFLRQLCACVKPNGILAVSFWQFKDVAKLAIKAQEVTSRAIGELGLIPGDLEENDFFLGWADDPDALRYCHHFDDAEIESLIESASPLAHAEALYKADTANRYAILSML